VKIKTILLGMLLCLPGLAGEVEVINDVVYGKGGDEILKLDIVRPKEKMSKPMPVIVFMHGGGWGKDWGDKKHGIGYLTKFAKRGYFGATINYRLIPKDKFPAQIEDCKCAVRFLRAHAKEYNIDPDHIASWGGSAGGHLASMLGTAGNVKEFEGTGGWEGYSSKVQAVIDCCGPVDLFKWRNQNEPGGMLIGLVGGASIKFKDAMIKASPITYVSKDAPPFLIVHGDKDDQVSIKQSQAFSEALKAAGVDVNFITIKDATHSKGWENFNEDKIVGDFLEKYLKK